MLISSLDRTTSFLPSTSTSLQSSGAGILDIALLQTRWYKWHRVAAAHRKPERPEINMEALGLPFPAITSFVSFGARRHALQYCPRLQSPVFVSRLFIVSILVLLFCISQVYINLPSSNIVWFRFLSSHHSLQLNRARLLGPVLFLHVVFFSLIQHINLRYLHPLFKTTRHHQHSRCSSRLSTPCLLPFSLLKPSQPQHHARNLLSEIPIPTALTVRPI